MRIQSWLALGASMAATVSINQAASFVDAVTDYHPGALRANLANYTNTSSVVGEPSRVTPGTWGGPVDPYNPPYLNSQLLAVGTNGTLTVQLGAPAVNSTSNPYGIDFIVFGGAGFSITNGDFSGGGITDGSIFNPRPGSVRVSVSGDNQTFYTLDSSLAPVFDKLYPTDGSGDFNLPVNPALTEADIAGKNLDQIRALYAGSAGGMGYDLNWAIDANGQKVHLDNAQFVRIDVLDGSYEIDGFATVSPVPEPSTSILVLAGLVFFGFRMKKGVRF
jgi:hypothetical protein